MIGASRHIYTRETRTTTQPTTQQPTSIFDMLNPHLRNVPAMALTGADEIYDYLKRCGPKTGEQIANKTGGRLENIRYLMRTDKARRFANVKGDLWQAQEPQEVSDDNRSTAKRVTDYLRTHPPAQVGVIADALQINRKTIESVLSRGVTGAIAIKDPEKSRGRLWTLPK